MHHVMCFSWCVCFFVLLFVSFLWSVFSLCFFLFFFFVYLGTSFIINNRKSHNNFRLLLKSVTLNHDLERRNGRYFALLRQIWWLSICTKIGDLLKWRNDHYFVLIHSIARAILTVAELLVCFIRRWRYWQKCVTKMETYGSRLWLKPMLLSLNSSRKVPIFVFCIVPSQPL